MALVVLALPAGASALEPGGVEEFSGATGPINIASGPDGNVWFTDQTAVKIGRTIVSGENKGKTELFGPLSGPSAGITGGPDGNVWFTEPTVGKIGKITPAGVITEYSLPEGSGPTLIVKGTDGSLWFIDELRNAIGRIPPAGILSSGVVEYPLGEDSAPCALTAGSAGNVWFGDCGLTRQVGKITPAGAITQYMLNEGEAEPKSMALNSDGNVWVYLTTGGKGIAKITPSGSITYYPAPSTQFDLKSLTTGSDGYVWGANVDRANEVQEVEISGATGGSYKLCKGDEPTKCTTALSLTATALTLKTALTEMFGAGNVNVGGTSATKRTATFVGALARTDVPLMICKTEELTPSGSLCTVKTTVKARTERFVRIKPSGKITEFKVPPATGVSFKTSAGQVTRGPDGNLWFVTEAGGKIGTFGLGFPVEYELTVNKEGSGDGTVVSSPAGIECGHTCSAEFEPGEHVTLVASPDPESVFVGWKGCDQVIGRECLVFMDRPRTVVAKFVGAPPLVASKAGGPGLGKVTSYPGGILCLAACTETSALFKEGTVVKLNQAPSKNHHFVEWTGACTGTGTCTVTIDEAKSVEAEFAENPKHSLSLAKKGGGQGTVKSLPAGVNCGIFCGSQAVDFYEDTVVVLTATVQADKGSTFAGWSGAGCSGTGTCTVTMSEAKSVEAEFE